MDDSRRCTAKSKQSQERCKRAAILGGKVCKFHGGGAPQVKAAADARLLAYEAMCAFGKLVDDPERVKGELAALAFTNAAMLFDERGRLKALKDLPPQVQAAVASSKIRRVNLEAGDGVTDEVVELKLWDKPKILELLAKHHGLAQERVSHDGTVTVVIKGME